MCVKERERERRDGRREAVCILFIPLLRSSFPTRSSVLFSRDTRPRSRMCAALKIHEMEMTRDQPRYDGLNSNSRPAKLIRDVLHVRAGLEERKGKK